MVHEDNDISTRNASQGHVTLTSAQLHMAHTVSMAWSFGVVVLENHSGPQTPRSCLRTFGRICTICPNSQIVVAHVRTYLHYRFFPDRACARSDVPALSLQPRDLVHRVPVEAAAGRRQSGGSIFLGTQS